MNIRNIVKRLTFALIFLSLSVTSWAQSLPKDLDTEFSGIYQLENSYSIIYNNGAQAAKLKSFKVRFYDPDGQLLLETEPETYPLDGTVQTYQLAQPVVGFKAVTLSILSLYEEGDITAFPASIGGILALNEWTEIAEEKTDTTPPPPPPPPVLSLSEAQKTALETALTDIDQTLFILTGKSEDLTEITPTQAEAIQKIETLADQNMALSDQVGTRNLDDLSASVDQLSAALLAAKTDTSFADASSDIKNLDTQLQALKSLADRLETQRIAGETNFERFDSDLAEINSSHASLDALVDDFVMPKAVTASQIISWQDMHESYVDQFEEAARPKWIWVAASMTIIALGALIFKFMLGGSASSRPSKAKLYKRARSSGVVFPASPMAAGNVAAPLSPAGQLTASQLQMLSGPYAILKDAYQATGRIGYAQEGVPTSKDYSFGTGFLISDRHVVTNRHVHGMYGHYLLDETDPGGIEFIAEKGKDASDFAAFNGQQPLLLPELDIAIYTLAVPVKNRKPIPLSAIETDTLDGQEVVVIGYPDTHTPEKPEIKAVVEDNAIFAVKRLSQGRIFRHTTDTDDIFGVQTNVSEDKNSDFVMPAICHNASTLGGNSGSPLLDLKTAQLVGIHFAGFKVFEREEAANLAMAVAQLMAAPDIKTMQA